MAHTTYNPTVSKVSLETCQCQFCCKSLESQSRSNKFLLLKGVNSRAIITWCGHAYCFSALSTFLACLLLPLLTRAECNRFPCLWWQVSASDFDFVQYFCANLQFKRQARNLRNSWSSARRVQSGAWYQLEDTNYGRPRWDHKGELREYFASKFHLRMDILTADSPWWGSWTTLLRMRDEITISPGTG